MLNELTLMVYTILGVHSYINQLWWMGSHNAISIAARAWSTLIMVSLTVPPIEARSTVTDVIAY